LRARSCSASRSGSACPSSCIRFRRYRDRGRRCRDVERADTSRPPCSGLLPSPLQPAKGSAPLPRTARKTPCNRRLPSSWFLSPQQGDLIVETNDSSGSNVGAHGGGRKPLLRHPERSEGSALRLDEKQIPRFARDDS